MIPSSARPVTFSIKPDEGLPATGEVFGRLAAHGRVLVIVDQPPRSAPWSWPSPARSGSRSPTCPDWRCAGSPTCTRARARPTPATPTSSPTPPTPCPTPCAGRHRRRDPRRTHRARRYDDDLAATRLTNRLRDALLHVHPALERLLGPRMDRGGVLDLLAAAPTPETLRRLGEDGIAATMRPRRPRLAKTLPGQILAALDAQTVVVPGTAAFGRVIVGVATQLREVRTERDTLAAELESRLEAHPLAEVLTSMPGLGFRTALKILTIVGDGAAFRTAGHLAAYAGLAPVTRRSGTSIKGETRSQRGNHALKSALFWSAFASLADPTSCAHYDRKRAQGKRHNAALICLAPPSHRRHLRDAPRLQALPAPHTSRPDSQPAAA